MYSINKDIAPIDVIVSDVCECEEIHIIEIGLLRTFNVDTLYEILELEIDVIDNNTLKEIFLDVCLSVILQYSDDMSVGMLCDMIAMLLEEILMESNYIQTEIDIYLTSWLNVFVDVLRNTINYIIQDYFKSDIHRVGYDNVSFVTTHDELYTVLDFSHIGTNKTYSKHSLFIKKYYAGKELKDEAFFK